MGKLGVFLVAFPVIPCAETRFEAASCLGIQGILDKTLPKGLSVDDNECWPDKALPGDQQFHQ